MQKPSDPTTLEALRKVWAEIVDSAYVGTCHTLSTTRREHVGKIGAVCIDAIDEALEPESDASE